ncbi:TetR/AcrR family transcriptional regulator [Leucobacter tenebrionis]|uniref:TetR/AcrR family transcriptional regulator n=1 Tax=Leucobacter tenebrionis TaxID=2873270 RepID=UPI001CA74F98|nr:TetR family transcriptional regulator [Leucobacter tenebrionis]QZY50933.1 TetR family transcriptional regulator [Leucobacter tenebrionis]
MRNTLADVVAAGLRVLDAQGLEGCSMRRVAAELGVQPSALYHHVPDKQTLLALMADEIVAPVAREQTAARAGAVSRVEDVARAEAAVPDETAARAEVTAPVEAGGGAAAAGAPAGGPDADPRSFCVSLRDAMLAVRDGADVVATAAAFRLGASGIERSLGALVGADGARTLLLYTFGHAQSTQTHRQAAAFGALVDPAALPGRGAEEAPDPDLDLDASFGRGLDIILRGLDAPR